MSNLAYHYDKSRMQDGEGFPGVPARSLTKEEYDALPAWLQAAVDGHPAYRKAPAKDEAQADKPAKGEE